MNNSYILKALSLFIILPLLLAKNSSAGEQYGIRTCAVQEVLDSGGYWERCWKTAPSSLCNHYTNPICMAL